MKWEYRKNDDDVYASLRGSSLWEQSKEGDNVEIWPKKNKKRTKRKTQFWLSLKCIEHEQWIEGSTCGFIRCRNIYKGGQKGLE